MKIAEHFYSLQGEGPSAGCPSVFLRLSGCNLLCGGADTLQTGELHDGATWRCDTIETWAHGEKASLSEVLELFQRNGYLSQLQAGAHLIITGGEPLQQQDEVVELLSLLDGHLPETRIFVEIETNGTILPEQELRERIDQWNVSPKLSNSGMPHERRLKLEVLRSFAALPHAFFKFVVTDPANVAEIEQEFVTPLHLPPSRILLMPGASSRNALLELFPSVAELCKHKGWRLSGRLQLEIWDQAVGV